MKGKYLIFILSMFILNVVHAEWKLDEKASSLTFITTKNNKVTELHFFRSLTGAVSNTGDAELVVNLGSVETNIQIRNDRVKQFFFETDVFPKALIKTKVDLKKITSSKPGALSQQTIKATLDLHGHKQEISVPVQVIYLNDDQIVVNSLKPMFIKVADFGLLGGLEKLQSIAKLNSINPTIPVDFNLIFKNK